MHVFLNGLEYLYFFAQSLQLIILFHMLYGYT